MTNPMNADIRPINTATYAGNLNALVSQVKEALKGPGYLRVTGFTDSEDNQLLLALGHQLGTPDIRTGKSLEGKATNIESQVVQRIETRSDLQESWSTPYRENSPLWMPCHSDAASREVPYGVVTFRCVRSDADGGGVTRVVQVPDVIALLPSEARETLSQPVFPYAFSPLPVLYQRGEALTLRYHQLELNYYIERSGTPLSNTERTALHLLDQAIDSPTHGVEFLLEPDDLLILNNFTTLHGRTGLAPDSRRLLKRMVVWSPLV
jgi:alpha-ketoglutarate-dependent taurine dioxygenase